MENKIKHLELIQGVINRMAANSFQLKGWTVVLVSALFALSAKDANSAFVYFAYFPVVAFWILDSFYLWQERLYRKLYDNTRIKQESEIDFSMDTRALKADVGNWGCVCFSATLTLFYVTVLFTIVLVTVLT